MQDLRAVIDALDPVRLQAALAEQPELATTDITGRGHPHGAAPLNYTAMLRFDRFDGAVWRPLPGTGEMIRILLAAGAPVDGQPEETETPLMTAASYGDAEVAAALVDGGADLDVLSKPEAGGVPEATALMHAAVFGMTDVLDVLVGAGAAVSGLTQAAAAGDLRGLLTGDTSANDRVLALIMAAHHERLAVLDELIAAGTPVDAEDEQWGRQALRLAASDGRAAAVAHLLRRGADPSHRDPANGRTALESAQRNRARLEPGALAEIERLLADTPHSPS